MRVGPRRVVAPDGTVWRVGRRWLPDLPRLRGSRRWRRRRRYDDGDLPSPDTGDAGFDLPDVLDDGLFLGAAIAAVFLVIFLVTALIAPLVILAVELVIVAAATLAGLAARLTSRRPWVVRARSDDGREESWNVMGFAASGRRRDAIAREIETTGRCGGWDSNPHVLTDTGT